MVGSKKWTPRAAIAGRKYAMKREKIETVVLKAADGCYAGKLKRGSIRWDPGRLA